MAGFKYTAQRPYYPYRRGQQAQGGGDFERGWQAGGQIAKSLGGLAGAIGEQQQVAQQNAIANRLMNTATPPRAALVDPGISPATGAANVIGPDVGTAGTAPLTGGIAEMKLRQQFAQSQLADQIQQARLAKMLAPAPGRLAGVQPQPGDAGAWGGYQVGGAQQPGTRSRTSRGQQRQEAQPMQIGSEPVTDQSQLAGHFDGTYGKGMFSKVMANINTAQVDDPANPKTVTITAGDKPINIPFSDAQVYTKQLNALRNRQGLAPFPVPGEDPSIGADQTNPYPTTNNLDVYSRPPGSWVKLPNGNIAQVPFQSTQR
jgi:hypothetical protein